MCRTRAASIRGFQSTPVIADGRSSGYLLEAAYTTMFQSTPVIADGRSALRAGPRCSSRSFNPRPSLLTGEAPEALRLAAWLNVSIHARHC